MSRAKNLSLYLPFTPKGKRARTTRAKMVATADPAMIGGASVVLPLKSIVADWSKNVRDDHRRQGDAGGRGPIDELAADMAGQGQLSPVGVRPLVDGKYELLYGFRRYEAAKKNKWANIRAEVTVLDDAGADWAKLRENEARHALSSYEAGRAYHRQHRAHGWKIAEIAAKSGKDEATIQNHVRTFDHCCQVVIERYRVGQFNSTTMAKIAAKLKDDKETQERFVEYVGGNRQGPAAQEALEEFLKVRDANGGVIPEGLKPGQTAESLADPDAKPIEDETPATEKPGKATLARALAWAKGEGYDECQHVLEWVIGKRKVLKIEGVAFDPDAERKAREEAKAEADKEAAAKKAAK